MSGLRVQTWESWIDGETDTTIEHESLFASTAASELGRRYCSLGKVIIVRVRLKSGTGPTMLFHVEAYVEMTTTEIKQGTN